MRPLSRISVSNVTTKGSIYTCFRLKSWLLSAEFPWFPPKNLCFQVTIAEGSINISIWKKSNGVSLKIILNFKNCCKIIRVFFSFFSSKSFLIVIFKSITDATLQQCCQIVGSQFPQSFWYFPHTSDFSRKNTQYSFYSTK